MREEGRHLGRITVQETVRQVAEGFLERKGGAGKDEDCLCQSLGTKDRGLEASTLPVVYGARLRRSKPRLSAPNRPNGFP